MTVDSDTTACPLCPETGFPAPPVPPTAAESSTSSNGHIVLKHEYPEEHWLACSKCSEWWHAACVLLSKDYGETVPKEVHEEIARSHQVEGPWCRWADWLDRWYCKKCIDWSRDPTNPRPPHHPLASTLKASFLKAQLKRTTSPSSAPSPKRPRMSSTQSVPPEDGKAARPKRKAAENAPDYYAWNHGIAAPTTKWLQLIADPAKYGAEIVDADFPCIPGKLLSKAWIESQPGDDAWDGRFPPSLWYGPGRQPLLIRPDDGGFSGLGGVLPGKDFTVDDVAELAGPSTMVPVIDVATQTSSQWPLSKWAEYFAKASEPGYNGKVYNVISLEITGTALAKKVRPPRIVREIDWVDNCWHFPSGGKPVLTDDDGHVKLETNGELETKPDKGKATWPKVQLYCLMGSRGSWTDWHVDFAASSVYYTIHTGSKEFYFIEPTEHNLKSYAEWSGSAESQSNTWLGSMCQGPVKRVRLKAGDTMIIPAGYIHAVYTPMNTLVFGGNFLHSYSIPAQLRLRQIEIDTKVPQVFRFPQFDKLCWYVADKFCTEMRQIHMYRPRATTAPPNTPCEVVLRGLVELAKFLQNQVDILEDSTAEDKKRKMVYDKVPWHAIKDPAGLAKELLWRVQRELPMEESVETVAVATSGKAKAAPTKSRRKTVESKLLPVESRTADFSPTSWDQHDEPLQHAVEVVMMRRPDTEGVEEEAEQVTDIRVQKRNRQRALLDGGLLLEEQEVVLTEKRTIWKSSVAVPNTNGHTEPEHDEKNVDIVA